MSVRLFDEPTFELHLIGKSPEDARLALDSEEEVLRMRQAIEAFAVFVAAGRRSAGIATLAVGARQEVSGVYA